MSYSRGTSIKTRIETAEGYVCPAICQHSRGTSIKTRIETEVGAGLATIIKVFKRHIH